MPQDALKLFNHGSAVWSMRSKPAVRGLSVRCLRVKEMQTILLAEDDDSMRSFLAKALERAGYDVVSYGNGAEALQGLKERPVTLLLTDIVMPEMDGIELAKRAAELNPEMKIMYRLMNCVYSVRSRPQACKHICQNPFWLTICGQEH